MKFLAGSRRSRLSTSQTEWILDRLRAANPDDTYAAVQMTTRGDTDSRPLFAIDQKGIFEKEIDSAVHDGLIDFAVHSLKDVPSELPAGLALACVPVREKVNDVLISKDGRALEGLPRNATVGTSSLRRAVQVTRKRPDITVKPIRGNIDTRIQKIGDAYDGIVLAHAGILRLGLDIRYAVLPIDDFVPSPGQGALALVARESDAHTIPMLKSIEDADTRLQVEAERALSSGVDSGCRFPVGAHAETLGDKMTLRVTAFSVDGSDAIEVEETGPKSDPVSLGRSAADRLQKKGIGRLALNWRAKLNEWNKA